MKHLLLTTIAAVLLVGCGTTQQSVSPAESKPEPPPKDIWEAAEQGDIKAVKQFITAAGLDVSIHDASMEGNIDAIKRHLAAGTDPNLANLGERFLGDFIKPPLHFSKNKEVAELLIAGGADVNFKDQTGWAILHYWSFFHYGQLELIELLVANGADVNAKDRLGNTPLDKAIEGGYRWKSNKEAREERAKIAEFLRKHGGKSGAPKSIVAAVNTANVEAVKKHLSSGGEESKKIKDVFLTAVRMDHREIVGLLLSSGTDLKAKLDESLHQAKSVEVAKLLIENGANVNSNSQNDVPPLHSIVRLISRRATIPAPDENQNNFIPLVELLIANGAEVNATDGQGNTAMDLVYPSMVIWNSTSSGLPSENAPMPAGMEPGNPAGNANEPIAELTRILHNHGGGTSDELQAAAESIEGAVNAGDIEAIKKHLASGADANKGLFAALNMVVVDVEIAELLITNGPDVNAKGFRERTPLHFAAFYGHKEIAELLIAAGADVNVKDKDGKTPLDAGETQVDAGETPLDMAIKRKRTEIADLLRKHGGKTGEELKAEGK